MYHLYYAFMEDHVMAADESMKGMKFTMTERRVLTYLGAREDPVTVEQMALALGLPHAVRSTIGPLWGRCLVAQIMIEAVNPAEHWTLSPRGRQVAEAGFQVHPHDRAVHVVRGPWAIGRASCRERV